jgi:hypothetical protein
MASLLHSDQHTTRRTCVVDIDDQRFQQEFGPGPLFDFVALRIGTFWNHTNRSIGVYIAQSCSYHLHVLLLWLSHSAVADRRRRRAARPQAHVVILFPADRDDPNIYLLRGGGRFTGRSDFTDSGDLTQVLQCLGRLDSFSVFGTDDVRCWCVLGGCHAQNLWTAQASTFFLGLPVPL